MEWSTILGSSALIPFLIVIILYLRRGREEKNNFTASHVLITGGSSGIGKATAKEVLRRGSNTVSLWARNKDKLNEARDEIMREFPGGMVHVYSVDVTNSMDDLGRVFQETVEAGGEIRMVIHCAGTSMSATLEDTSLQDFEKMMRINYFGSVSVAKVVVPYLKSLEGGRKSLTFISSVAGVMGLYGYTAYSASKFALRGLSESLEMEARPHGLSITLSLPPDTDTPSFEEENKSKPLETALLSEAGGLFQPEIVAQGIVEDTVNGVFLSTVGLDGWLLKCITFGMSPTPFGLMVIQVFLVGPLRFVAWCYTMYFARIVGKCHFNKKKNLKSS
eukprot:TRINITY_DN4396_c0_g1_i1.p1 TRINITY_DN4396_c0_g1~~TRINITY_DN4396_c0_g1_i1.p1  ORF type:complete len:333 (+),score=66.81 TRINITY_DN4396_c0_g1_i1:11-1009(+)